MSPASASKPNRRTQAERTATTKAALLAATIDGVVESGYAAVTSADIAKRAGVTRGALAHHFASKNDLVVAAVQYVSQQITDLFIDILPKPGTGTDAVGPMLDTLWALHTSREYVAALDLWVGARTEPELRGSLRALQRELSARFRAAAHDIFSDTAPTDEIARLLNTTILTMRGLAMTTYMEPDADWHAARDHLELLWRTVLDAPE